MFTQAQEIEICEYYWTRLSTGYYPSYQEVGEHYGCSGAMVKLALNRSGYKRRTNAETREGRPCKPINQPEGNAPLCACGCGQETKWISKDSKWQKYVQGHYRPKHTYHDPEWLRSEYIDKARSIHDMADQFGVCTTSIIKAMNKHGIERRETGQTLSISGAVRGANNPAWKGGVADWDYSHDWKALSKKIKDRDQWTCQLCGEQRKYWGSNLHVHHIDEDKTNNHPHNLISLCSKCHHPIHGKDDIRTKLHQIAIINTGGAIEHPQFRH